MTLSIPEEFLDRAHPYLKDGQLSTTRAMETLKPAVQNRQPARRPGHPGFLSLLDEMRKAHLAKDSDYAGASPPFENFRKCAKLGVSAWKGALIRMQDKWERLMNLVQKEIRNEGPAVADESLEDTLLDLSSYSLIVLALRREAKH